MAGLRRDHYLSPSVDAHSQAVVDAALASLGARRGLGLAGDAAVGLHLLASLIAEANGALAAAVADARDQGCSWAQIADLLGVTRATAWQRYGQPSAPEPAGGATVSRRGH